MFDACFEHVKTALAFGRKGSSADVANLLESVSPTYAVPSPGGRHVAFPEWTLSTNAGLFHAL